LRKAFPTLAIAAIHTSILLTGCGIWSLASSSTPGNSLTGGIHGGQQPISGAHIYLFAAGSSAYGGLSLPLLDPSASGVQTDANGPYVLSDANGNFLISHAYSCTPGQQVYLLALGGNPGLAEGISNPAISLFAALSPCPGDGNLGRDNPHININELTTVAAAYALSGYTTDFTRISSGPSDASKQGIANAFAVARTLVDVSSGTANTNSAAGNGIMPQAELNTLANILSACVNSTGSGGPCGLLFSATTGDAPTPADTFSTAVRIARHPALNVASLFAIAQPNPPFQPGLTAAPNDWTLAVTYQMEQMAGPYFPAVDSMGNLWVPAYGNSRLFGFSPTGVPLAGDSGFTNGGLNQPFALAIDQLDRIWAVNFGPVGHSGVSVFSNSGTPITSSAYACAAACFFPAFDGSGNLWISGDTRTTVLTPGGTQAATFSTNSYDSGLVIDPAGRAWTLGHAGAVYRFSLPSNVSQFSQQVTSTSGNELTPMAADASGNIWFVSNKNNRIGNLDPNGNLVSGASGYTGGGLQGPAGIAIDGGGNVWIANRDGNSISEFANDGTVLSPSTGFKSPDLSGPRGIAIDSSGNVWVSNFTYNSVTEFVGAAVPLKTPLAPNTTGQRP
jgi:hypothetical protein